MGIRIDWDWILEEDSRCGYLGRDRIGWMGILSLPGEAYDMIPFQEMFFFSSPISRMFCF
jgi:hypothetical protein